MTDFNCIHTNLSGGIALGNKPSTKSLKTIGEFERQSNYLLQDIFDTSNNGSDNENENPLDSFDLDGQNRPIPREPAKDQIINFDSYDHAPDLIKNSIRGFEVTHTNEETGVTSGRVTPGINLDRTNFEFNYDPDTNILDITIPIFFRGAGDNPPHITEAELKRVNDAVDLYIENFHFPDGKGNKVSLEINVVPTDNTNSNYVYIERGDPDSRANIALWNFTPNSPYNFDGTHAHEVAHLLGLPDEYHEEGASFYTEQGDDDSLMRNSHHENARLKPEHAQGFMQLISKITGEPSIADVIAKDLMNDNNGNPYKPKDLQETLNISFESAQLLSLKYGQGQPLDEIDLKEMAEDGTIFKYLPYKQNSSYNNLGSNLTDFPFSFEGPLGVNLTNVPFSYHDILNLVGEEDETKFDSSGIKVDLKYILDSINKGHASINTDSNGITTLTIQNELFYQGPTQ